MSIGRDIRCHQMGEKTLLNVPISAPSLAVSLQLQSVGGEGLAVEWLGHDTPVRANSPPSFDEQNAAEKIVLHIEEIETPQVARLINAAKMHGVHLNTALEFRFGVAIFALCAATEQIQNVSGFVHFRRPNQSDQFADRPLAAPREGGRANLDRVNCDVRRPRTGST